MNVPSELRYSREHEWVRVDGSIARVGITDFAQESLGDVVFVQLPDVGLEIVAGASASEIESTKSVSDVYVPVSGVVQAVNAFQKAEVFLKRGNSAAAEAEARRAQELDPI